MPLQDRPFFHTTTYPAALSSSQDPSVNMTTPGLPSSLRLGFGLLFLQQFGVKGFQSL